MLKRPLRDSQERYELARSPLAERPTQRDLAELLRESRGDLEKLATKRFKEEFIVRRTIESGGKQRALVYPVSRLRTVHERLKFHLSKIIQPSYLMSPRKGRAQRDNAAAHLNALRYLTLDLKQFYPSTTRGMIRNSLISLFGMAPDVAGLIAHLSTADDRACFGSPLTPVLATLVHRQMFDAVAELCNANGLNYTVWVDDLTISGSEITGQFIARVREIIALSGLKSHKLKLKTGNRPVFITGVGIVGANLIVPTHTELRSKELWQALKDARSLDEQDVASTRLLAHLGGIRYVIGKDTERGKKIASEMNSIRQKRNRAFRRAAADLETRMAGRKALSEEEIRERHAEIIAMPF